MAVNMSAREDAEQATLFSWAQMQSGKYPELSMLFHIPNGGKRDAKEAARFRAEGVKAGVPDLLLPVARQGKHGLWIEMKRREGGRVSEYQSEWIDKLRRQGYRVEVCCGWEEASRVLLNYLSEEEANEIPAVPVAAGKGRRKQSKGFNFETWMETL